MFFCSLSVVLAAPSDGKKYEQKDDGIPVDIKLPVKHILSRELQVIFHCLLLYFGISSFCILFTCSFFLLPLQLYFDKITELVVSRSNLVIFKEALVSLATDSGLHPLVPYFTCFIADEVINLEIIADSYYKSVIYSHLLLIPTVIN